MRTIGLVYPHQLYPSHPAVAGADEVVLVEEPLFFRQYRFHRQKLMLHRASLQRYAAELSRQGRVVRYVEASDLRDTGDVVRWLPPGSRVQVVDVCDDWLEQRLTAACQRRRVKLIWREDPCFLTSRKDVEAFAAQSRKLFFTEFYIQQRKRLGLLLADGRPVGGKWSFDRSNRKRLPRSVVVPSPPVVAEDKVARHAREYVQREFPTALGADEALRYPSSRSLASQWLEGFIADRLALFGDYEDAISVRHAVLFHSVLTPMLNVGLLSPREVVEAALTRADQVPINALEGFIRQVIGWREFIRLVYLTRGRRQRSRNFWRCSQPLPAAFYHATTGIEPVDHIIRRVLLTGYCHHIERLMVLGNFMLLCDIHPDAVYQWFMEMFVDAYDWVMVPNVYGMSQHADGGLMTTKPYISGSSYIRKMSDFPPGPWCHIWDALYWRFIDRHEAFFAANPRMAVMVKLKHRLGRKLQEHHRRAEAYLERLHGAG